MTYLLITEGYVGFFVAAKQPTQPKDNRITRKRSKLKGQRLRKRSKLEGQRSKLKGQRLRKRSKVKKESIK